MSRSTTETGARAVVRDWRRAPAPAVALAPMIDVVFLLLLYFLLAAEFRQSERFVPVELASRSTSVEQADPLTLPRTPVILTIRSTGPGAEDYQLAARSPALGDVQTFEALREALARSRGEIFADDQPFIVRVGDRARWEHTLRAIETIRSADYTRVTLAEPSP